jgi:hypothetical protein
MVLAETWEELQSAFKSIAASQDQPMLQEFIPAETKRNFYMVVNRDMEIVSLFSPQVARTRNAGLLFPCAAVVSTTDIPYTDEVRALVHELGIWGGITLQTLVDKRDGKPKLMEVNPRFGNHLWFRTELGINDPIMFLRLCCGEDPYDTPGQAPDYPEGVILLDPLLDLLHLVVQVLGQSIAWIRGHLTGKARAVGPLRRDSISQLLKDHRTEYFSRRPRVTSPLNRGWLSDPLPPLSRMIRVMSETFLRGARRLLL